MNNIIVCYIINFQIILISGSILTNSYFRETYNTEPAVVLIDLSYGHNIVGKEIQLQCLTTLYAKYIAIDWTIPEHVTPRITQQNITEKGNTNSIYVTTSTLVIENAPRSGLYYCEVNLLSRKSISLRSNELKITIYGTQETVLKTEPSEIVFDKFAADVVVNIKAHPDVDVVWRNQHKQTIKSSSNVTFHKTAVNDSTYNYMAKLSFDYITKNDLGTYSVYLRSGNLVEKPSFQISFEERVDLKIYKPEDFTYKCVVAGNSEPDITWIFEPCDLFDCSTDSTYKLPGKHLILNQSTYENHGLQTISYISLNVTGNGILRCVSNNINKKLKIFVHVNRFDIFVNTAAKDGKKVYVGYGQFVNIACIISYFEYINYIEWHHNGEYLINDKDSVWYTIIPENNIGISEVRFAYNFENMLGNFSCTTITRTGEIKSKTVEVLPKRVQNLFPQISLEDLNSGHTVAGQDIKLKCSVTFHEHVQIVWICLKNEHNESERQSLVPTPLENCVDRQKVKQNDSKTISNTGDNVYITTSYFTISQATTAETAYYDCQATLSTQYRDDYIWVRVYDVNDKVVRFHQNSKFNVQNMTIVVFIAAHPRPTIQWFDNNGNEISHQSSNFAISSERIMGKTETNTNYEIKLTFKNLTLDDFGNYTIVAKNKNKILSNYSIPVNVTGIPSTKIDIYTTSKDEIILKCSAIAYPKPTIQWFFKQCTASTNCLEFTDKSENNYFPRVESWNETKGFQHISYIFVNLSESGVLRCRSKNKFGEDFVHEPILGYGNEFVIFTDDKNNEHNFSFNQTIELVGTTKELNVTCATSVLNYTRESILFYNNQQLSTIKNPGLKIPDPVIQQDFLFSSFTVATIEAKIPGDSYYFCTVLNKNGLMKTGTLHLQSQLQASITFNNTNMKNDTVHLDIGSKLILKCFINGFPKPSVKWFKNNEIILASESNHFSKDKQLLEINHISPDDGGIYMCEASNKFVRNTRYAIVSVVVPHTWIYVQSLLLLLAFFLIATLAFIKYRNEKELIDNLKLFGLVDFTKNPMNKLNPKLGIGNQASLLPYDPKWEIPLEKIKIGKQLGSGAFGVTFKASVVDYFSDDPNKTVAVKTVNPLSGFDSLKALGSEIRIMSHMGKHVNIVNLLGACTKNIIMRELYMVLEFCSIGNLLDYIHRCSDHFVDQKDESSDSFKWINDDNNIITSKDLLLWSFQIARGMDYLGFRRIVHGDLAARNILLTDNNVVKVCDFGLAEHMYNYRNYVKKVEGRLPIRWMPLEAIEKGIFSIQSDIWSFGVVLWEIFSLGKTPYAGINVDQTFCKLLSDGYRMEEPKAATADVYKFMTDCWNIDPLLRPSFASLEDRIGLLLDESVRHHFVVINSDYMLMNKQQFDISEDYMTMLLPPTYDNVVSQLSETQPLL